MVKVLRSLKKGITYGIVSQVSIDDAFPAVKRTLEKSPKEKSILISKNEVISDLDQRLKAKRQEASPSLLDRTAELHIKLRK